MRVVVFGSRLQPAIKQDYRVKNGERLAAIEFDTTEELAAWRQHAAHLETQQEGREP